MSDVVYQETKRHFKLNVRDVLEKLRQEEKKLENFKPPFLETYRNGPLMLEKEPQDLLRYFETFYEKLQSDNVLHILPSPNDILPELIKRAVNRKKPFKENKSEFRDAVTWLTYVNYVEQNKLSDCYLITNNTNDFFNDEKSEIHPELL